MYFRRGRYFLLALVLAYAAPAYAAAHPSLTPDPLPPYENAASVPFAVHVNFSPSDEPVFDFATSTVSLTNATITGFATTSSSVAGTDFDFYVLPRADGPVSISIPDSAMHSVDDASSTLIDGNVASNVINTIYDGTPPIVGAMPDVSLDATSSVGATVIFDSPTATDTLSGIASVVCTPASGSVFTIGTTSVECIASDVAGNTASTTFVVSMRDTSESSLALATTTALDGSVEGSPAGLVYVATSTPTGIVTLDMEAHTTLTGTSTWDGTLMLPEITADYSPPTPATGDSASVTEAIEVGSPDVPLTLDHAARLAFVGQAGALVGYSYGSATTFVPVTTICTADSQSIGDALPQGGDCTIHVGNDLVVWTKHFSSFVTYTQTALPAQSSGGGGGGGGGGGDGATSILATPEASIATSTAMTTQSGVLNGGEVLGAQAYNFTQYLTLGSRGNEVEELQNYLVAAHVLASSNVTGYFGVLTEAAVNALQEKNGIPETGTVGPKTRALLNRGFPSDTGSVLGAQAYNFAQYLTLGSRGNDVEELQNILVSDTLLAQDDVTGYFGPLTQEAVMEYQKQHNIPETGTVGPKTRTALNQEEE